MNRDGFLKQLFNLELNDQERITIARQTQKNGFKAMPWPENQALEATHFCISSMAYPQNHQNHIAHPHFRRRNEHWKGMWLLVLDDVGEKVKAPDLAPTYRLETSPGSEQWGYVFDRPLRNESAAEALIDGAIAAGLSDPGAKGRIRLVRLPGTDPKRKGFEAELILFEPERRFNPKALPKQLGFMVKPRPVSVFKRSIPLSAVNVVHLPPDPMLAWLKANGWVTGKVMSDGWWPIRCPWIDEHTDNDDSGTRYHETLPDDPIRSFKCHHGHCQHRTSADFREYFATRGAPPINFLRSPPLVTNLKMTNGTASSLCSQRRPSRSIS